MILADERRRRTMSGRASRAASCDEAAYVSLPVPEKRGQQLGILVVNGAAHAGAFGKRDAPCPDPGQAIEEAEARPSLEDIEIPEDRAEDSIDECEPVTLEERPTLPSGSSASRRSKPPRKLSRSRSKAACVPAL
jgi:hypothetical protein